MQLLYLKVGDTYNPGVCDSFNRLNFYCTTYLCVYYLFDIGCYWDSGITKALGSR